MTNAPLAFTYVAIAVTLVGLGGTVLITGVVGVATGGSGLIMGGTFILGAGGSGVADLCHISHCADEANQFTAGDLDTTRKITSTFKPMDT